MASCSTHRHQSDDHSHPTICEEFVWKAYSLQFAVELQPWSPMRCPFDRFNNMPNNNNTKILLLLLLLLLLMLMKMMMMVVEVVVVGVEDGLVMMMMMIIIIII